MESSGVWKSDGATLDLGHLTFEYVDLFEVTIDPGLQHLLELVPDPVGLVEHILLVEVLIWTRTKD